MAARMRVTTHSILVIITSSPQRTTIAKTDKYNFGGRFTDPLVFMVVHYTGTNKPLLGAYHIPGTGTAAVLFVLQQNVHLSGCMPAERCSSARSPKSYHSSNAFMRPSRSYGNIEASTDELPVLILQVPGRAQSGH